jgi:prepilin peptidase CpaA
MTSIVLFIILMISFYTDIKERKILNIVTFPAMAFGLIFYGISTGMDGFLFSILGLLTGLGLLIIPYALGGMAAGDVKLLMAIGALKGTSFVFGSFIYIALVGGVIALLILLFKRRLLSTLKRIFVTAKLQTLAGLSEDELHQAFPYGVAIVLGTVCYVGVNGL